MRKPAVAGMFYPANKEELKRVVNDFLEKGREVKFSGKLKALIVPHAGYIYSGIVAGAGFKLLRELKGKIKKVILLGPSHQAYFRGAAIACENFETPLGVVKVGDVSKWLKEQGIGELKEAHLREHCLEVELPFLQEVLGNRFELYALVLGELDGERAHPPTPSAAGEEAEKRLAESISKFIDEETLVVVSSDLSHYHRYDFAVERDKKSIERILGFDFSGEIDACGKTAILVLMHLAKKRGWKPFLIDYKNSGDTAGDKERVVGYAAVGYGG